MESKETQRARLRARLRDLDESYIRESDAGILRQLLVSPAFWAHERLFAYWSVGREVDTRGILDAASRAGKQVFLPICLEGGALDFAAWSPEQALERGAYGIPIPPADAPRSMPEAGDLLLVPALGYDRQGFRMGRGGGYYDRLLKRSGALALGLCREAMLLEDLCLEPHDCRVDFLVTEERQRGPFGPRREMR